MVNLLTNYIRKITAAICEVCLADLNSKSQQKRYRISLWDVEVKFLSNLKNHPAKCV